MTLDSKIIVMILACLLLIVTSIIPFRWLILNDIELERGNQLVTKGLGDLRKLKKNVDTFVSMEDIINNDEKLKKEYYEKQLRYHNELGRESVELIEDVLNALYLRNAFFELDKISMEHQTIGAENKLPPIKLLIDGNKRLIKE